jgi:hypothetical protein
VEALFSPPKWFRQYSIFKKAIIFTGCLAAWDFSDKTPSQGMVNPDLIAIKAIARRLHLVPKFRRSGSKGAQPSGLNGNTGEMTQLGLDP